MVKDSGGDDGESELVMEYTPPPAFDVRTVAHEFAHIMKETGHPLIINLPHMTVEFEPGCTAKEIIDGYNMAIKRKTSAPASNTNKKEK